MGRCAEEDAVAVRIQEEAADPWGSYHAEYLRAAAVEATARRAAAGTATALRNGSVDPWVEDHATQVATAGIATALKRCPSDPMMKISLSTGAYAEVSPWHYLVGLPPLEFQLISDRGNPMVLRVECWPCAECIRCCF